MLNFIPTPRAIMNELFYEPTKHNRLQDVIHMFTLHICPTATQRSCQHCDKVNTLTSKEISNSDIISFVIKKNIVNSSIPKWWDINNGENNSGEVKWQPPNCCCVILKMKGCFTFLPPQVVDQQLASNGLTRL